MSEHVPDDIAHARAEEAETARALFKAQVAHDEAYTGPSGHDPTTCDVYPCPVCFPDGKPPVDALHNHDPQTCPVCETQMGMAFRSGVRAEARRSLMALTAAGMHDGACPDPRSPCTCGLAAALAEDAALASSAARPAPVLPPPNPSLMGDVQKGRAALASSAAPRPEGPRAAWNIDANGVQRSPEWWQGYRAAQRSPVRPEGLTREALSNALAEVLAPPSEPLACGFGELADRVLARLAATGEAR